ncbi:MAG: hypothetical protein P3W87_001215 [Gammaproteobacteria bacterium]|nr:hypothetical protein [Gammaproteobacteria bacterium]
MDGTARVEEGAATQPVALDMDVPPRARGEVFGGVGGRKRR